MASIKTLYSRKPQIVISICRLVGAFHPPKDSRNNGQRGRIRDKTTSSFGAKRALCVILVDSRAIFQRIFKIDPELSSADV